MIRNYILTAWRNLMKYKFYSVINISGLAIGLAVGIMILLWVQDERSYDGFHRQAANIYKVNSHLGSGSSAQVWATAPAPLTVLSSEGIPEVVNSVRIKNEWGPVRFVYKDKKIIQDNAAYVDSGFFGFFDFKLLKGSPSKPFSDEHSVLISTSLARKIFGEEEPMGKVLQTEKENFMVSGVMEDFPGNSNLHYDILFPLAVYGRQFTANGGNGAWKTIDEDLGDFEYSVFFQLRPKASPEMVAKKITKLFLQRKDESSKNDYFALQALTTLHLLAPDGNSGARQTVNIFLIVAILILSIACINYVNLSTARAILRSKEVSVRKMIGAGRAQLFIQFIAETALIFLFASLLAVCLIYFLMPVYNEISGKRLLFSLGDFGVWIVVGSAVLGSLILSSVYPALLLSSFRPIEALKGKISFGIGNAAFRKTLVVIQFVFSVGLIICTGVIRYQLKYIRDKDLGFDKEHVLSFNMREELHAHYDAVRTELLKEPGVMGIASAKGPIAGVNSTTGDTDWEGKEAGKMFLINTNGIDEHLIPLLRMKLVAGRNFTGAKADTAYVILNETAVRQTGIKDPIGKRFTLWQTNGTIIGIVRDFNYASLKKSIEPAIFYYGSANRRMFIKTRGRDAAHVIARTEKIWKQYCADYPFEYTFLDEDFNRMYESEQRTAVLFNVFAAVAILISCLGLFSLATYTAEVKTKEIGIRKVLGATVGNITQLLAKEFIWLVGLAFCIATPIAWFMMHQWLQNYAYQVSLSGWIFLGTGIGVMTIALLTVCFQALKAGMANPVKSLRTE